MRKARVGEIGEDVLIIGSLAVLAYFFVLKPMLTGDNPDFDNEVALDPTQNPFSHQFQPFIDFYNNNTPSIPSTGSPMSLLPGWSTLFGGGSSTTSSTPNTSPTMQQFFTYLKANPGIASPWGMLDTADLSQRCENLKAAVDVPLFKSASDQTGAMSALSGFTRQLQVAFMANYFWYNWNIDLLSYLNGSLFNAGLTPQNLSLIINTVNNLPV